MQGAGCRVQGAGCRVQGAGCRVQGAGCRVRGAGCRVHMARVSSLWSLMTAPLHRGHLVKVKAFNKES